MALHYMSGAPDAWIGRGWGLEGISTITRTSAHGGVPLWGFGDKELLDGMELVPCPLPGAPVPGNDSPSCRYRIAGTQAFVTRVESFQRVAFDQAANEWQVWRPDGVKATYGAGLSGSQGTYDWHIIRMEDPGGQNVVTFDWKPDLPSTLESDITPAQHLEAIHYGDVQVRFQAEAAPRPIVTATGGRLVATTTRLSTIVETAGGRLLRAYQLRYVTRPDEAGSILRSVQRLGSDAVVDASGAHGGTALPPVTFGAPSPPAGGSRGGVSPAPLPADWRANWPTNGALENLINLRQPPQIREKPAVENEDNQWVTADVTGDGRADFVLAHQPYTGAPIELVEDITRPGGGYEQRTIATPWPWPGRDHVDALVGDINADGGQDLVIIDDANEVVHVAVDAGDRGLVPQPATSALPPALFAIRRATSPAGQFLLGDSDADGRADLIAVFPDAGCSGAAACTCADATARQYAIAVGLSDGSGQFLFPLDSSLLQSTCWPTSENVSPAVPHTVFQLADVNGDLRADVVGFRPAGITPTAHVFTATASTGGRYVPHEQDTRQPWGRGTRIFTVTTRKPGAPLVFTRFIGPVIVPAFWEDTNGDGRSDLIVARPADKTTSLDLWTADAAPDGSLGAPSVAHTTASARGMWRTFDDVDPPDNPFRGGDFNGDGRGDLALIEEQDAGATITRLISDTDGSWSAGAAASQSWASTCGAEFCKPSLTSSADIDGDGRDDLLFVRPQWRQISGTNMRFDGFDADLTPAGPSRSAMLFGDVDGDGRDDVIVPVVTATGTEIRTLIRDSAGGLTARPPFDLPASETDPCSESAGAVCDRAANSWQALDLNGDRRADLVSTDGARLTTVVSTGDGWELSGARVIQGGMWRVGDVNGDGRDDLIHPNAPLDLNRGVATLLGQPDGTLEPGREIPPPSGTPQSTDTLAWKVADVDGDHDADLVHVDSRSGTVLTARRTGGVGGFWSITTDRPFAAPLRPPTLPGHPGLPTPPVLAAAITSGDDPAWVAMDVNGDGAVDLVHLRFTLFGDTVVTTLLSEGDGHWKAITALTSARAVPGAFDTQDWRPLDFNNDGRTDLVRVRNNATEVRQEVLRSLGDGSWLASSAPLVQDSVSGDRGAWLPWPRSSGTYDERKLVWHDNDVSEISIPTGEQASLIASVDNGLGTTTSIDYETARDTQDPAETTRVDCRLPQGVNPPLARTVTTRDAASDTQSTTATDYHCPRWSNALGVFLGWTETATHHSAAPNRAAYTESVQRQIDLEGVVQTIADRRQDDSQGGQRTEVLTTYKPLGEGPLIDLPATERTLTCQVDRCAGQTESYDYDANGNLKSDRIDGTGAGHAALTKTLYVENPERFILATPRRTSMHDPAQPDRALSVTITCYDADTSPDCTAPPSRGLATTTRRWTGAGDTFVTTSATYDAFGNRLTATNENHRTTTTTFDPQGLFPTQSCNALEQCTDTPIYDRIAEQPTTITDPNHATSTAVFDALGRVQVQRNALGQTTTISSTTPAAGGNDETERTTINGSVLLSHTVTDGLGRTIRTSHRSNDGKTDISVDTHYGDAGADVYRTSLPHRAGATTRFLSHFYDGLERPTRTENPDGTSATTSYELATDPSGSGDPVVLTTARDEASRQTRRVTDGLGEIVASQQPSLEHPGQWATTRYEYDALGRRTSVTDSHANHSATDFDALGRVATERDPDRGTTRYGYDAAGNLTTRTDSLSHTRSFAYDALNRRTETRDGQRRLIATWHYDQPGHGASVGRLTATTDPSAQGCPGQQSHQLSYDLLGGQTDDWRCIEGRAFTTKTTYDGLGRPGTLTYPDGQTLRYAYDAASQIRSISGVINNVTYDSDGQLGTIQYANGTIGHWQHNPDTRRLTRHSVTRASKTLFDDSYTYELDGLLHSRSSPIGKVHDTYTYDPVSQLAKTTGTHNQSLTYDDLGDITRNSPLGAYTYAHPAAGCRGGPHAATSAGRNRYCYDPAGRLTNATGPSLKRSVTWNDDGLPTRIVANSRPTTLLYDADDTRVQTTSGAKSTNHYGPLVDWSRDRGLVKYVYLGSQLVAQRARSHTTFYTIDQVGSPRLLTDDHGAITARTDYAPFGGEAPSRPDQSIGYAGHRRVDDTGLVDMNSRYYDPQLARMLSPDSIIPRPDDPRALNRYSYAHNDPLSYVDPDGHKDTYDLLCTDANTCYFPTVYDSAVSGGAWSFGYTFVTSLVAPATTQNSGTTNENDTSKATSAQQSAASAAKPADEKAPRPKEDASVETSTAPTNPQGGSGETDGARSPPTPGGAAATAPAAPSGGPCSAATMSCPPEVVEVIGTPPPPTSSASATSFGPALLAALPGLFSYRGVHFDLGRDGDPRWLEKFLRYAEQQRQYPSSDRTHFYEKLFENLRGYASRVARGKAPAEDLRRAIEGSRDVFERGVDLGVNETPIAIGEGTTAAESATAAGEAAVGAGEAIGGASALSTAGAVLGAGILGYQLGTAINNALDRHFPAGLGGWIYDKTH